MLIKLIPFSKDWYKGIITDEELEALEHPKPKPRPSEETIRKRNGNKKRPKQIKPVVQEDEEEK